MIKIVNHSLFLPTQILYLIYDTILEKMFFLKQRKVHRYCLDEILTNQRFTVLNKR